MKFGIAGLNAALPPSNAAPHRRYYEELVSLARAAERNGFDSVTVPEHHFWDNGYVSSPLSVAAALATATESVTIGTGIAVAPLYDPIRLAEAAATIDQLSGGRFKLGLGNGYIRREFETFDVPMRERGRRTDELIDVCTAAWSDGPFSYDGEVFDYEDVDVQPKPVQPGGPPVVVGGYARRVLDRAAEKADGWLGVIKYSADVDEDADDGRSSASSELFGENVEYLASRRDLAEFSIELMQYGYAAEDDESAWEQFLPAFVQNRRAYARNAGESDAWDLQPENWDLDTMPDSRIRAVREGTMVGSPETIVERLHEYDRMVPGELHYAINLAPPELDFEQARRCIELYGEEIIPELS